MTTSASRRKYKNPRLSQKAISALMEEVERLRESMADYRKTLEELRTLRESESVYRALAVLAERAYAAWNAPGHEDTTAEFMHGLYAMLRQIERAPLMPPRGVFSVLALPRAGGKTAQMVQRVLRENGVLIVANEDQRRSLLGYYPHLKENQVLSWTSAAQKLRGHSLQRPDGRLPVYIDNADFLLREIIGRDISGISVSL